MQKMLEEQGRRDKAMKVEAFRRRNLFVKKGQILFCGSSLMEMFPVEELLMDLGLSITVYNRGVGGFTTTELLEVLDPCVFQLEPKYIFINIGTNDLSAEDYTLEGLVARYQSILDQIKARLPQAVLHLMAYYPVNEPVGLRSFMPDVFTRRTNRRIAEANQAVEALAGQNGALFHNFNQGITAADGSLKEEYTIEGMHMYPDGYRAVLEEMLEVLKAAGQDCAG
ncbi:MAG: lysophospholipase [Acutalibacter sp.]|nr:lysophospholipase [Acutalibacter sp.]